MASLSTAFRRIGARAAGNVGDLCKAIIDFPGRLWREPETRDKTLAAAVFAGIIGFGALAMDALVTGNGPDWDPGALAAPAAYAYQPPPAPVAAIDLDAAPFDFALPLTPVDFETSGDQNEELLGGPEELFVAASFHAAAPVTSLSDISAPAPTQKAQPIVEALTQPITPEKIKRVF